MARNKYDNPCKSTMNFKEWEPYYREILSDFDFDPEKDMLASSLLSSLVSRGVENGRLEPLDNTMGQLRALLYDKKVYVFGGGPNLQSELDRAVRMKLFDLSPEKIYNKAADYTRIIEVPRWKKDIVKSACDGTTAQLLHEGIIPEMVVTDLDGDVVSQLEAQKKGTILVVHAHGDNMPALEKWVPQMKGKIIPTCQCAPEGLMSNFGGFTDGDRGVFLAEEMGARGVMLVGFDPNIVGEKTGRGLDAEKIKSKKLAWAFALLGNMRFRMNVDFFDGFPV